MTPSRSRRISPSDVARYFFHNCERFLRYRASDKAEKASAGIPDHDFDRSPLMRAIMESGNRWEEEVVTRLLKGRVHIASGDGELNQRRFKFDETVALLRTAKPGTFIYQATLRASPLFYQTHGLDPSLVSFSDNHPDLISVLEGAGRRLLRVIDVKRGTTLQVAYRVQILLYALELEAMLREAGITDACVDMERAGVWLGGHDQPEEFDLAAVRPHVEQFLRVDLDRILRLPPEDAAWHLFFRCEWCEYFEHCRDQMYRDNDLSRIANLTVPGKQHLIQLGVRNLPQLDDFLQQSGADEALVGCASLAGDRHYLHNRVRSLLGEKPIVHGASTPALPQGENIAVVLTLQREPLGATTYLAGLLVNIRQDLQDRVFDGPTRKRLFNIDGKAQPSVLVASQPHQVPEVRRQFVRLLFDMLRQVHLYNEGRDWKDQLMLQVYVHTERDKAQLIALLIDSLHEADLAEQAMQLLFHFQGPDLMQTDEHPETTVPYSVVTLLSALGRLIAVPVDVSYRLPETLAALGTSVYQRKDYYHYPIGHGLRPDAIHAAWYRGQADHAEMIRAEAGLYLLALRSLLWDLRKHVKDQLFAWAPRFALPGVARLNDPILSRLAFFARYESLLGCLALREQRSEARAVQVTLGQTLQLISVDGFELQTDGQALLDIEDDERPQWLLVRDSDTGRRAQLEFRDYLYRNFPSGENYGPRPAADLAVVGVKHLEVDELGFPKAVQLKSAKNFSSGPPQRGDRFLLYPRFMDYNTDRIVAFLEQCDRDGGGLYLEVLRDPEQAAGLRLLAGAIDREAASAEKALGFTDSQVRAFREIRRRKVVAVWGPPGTGKTHFLATAILGLALAHQKAGKPFRVLVTAFTHNAIENLLAKILSRQTDLHIGGDTLSVIKVEGKYRDSTTPTDAIDEKAAAAWLAQRPRAVVGATVYSCIKARQEPHFGPFDLVVVDEASQVRVPEASVPFRMVADSGRIVLAGDHCQLPPIVQGEYPETPPGQPVLHRSIFEALQAGVDANGPVVQKLLENHRMNAVLTRFAAELLYGPGYKCFSPEVALRRLDFQPPAPLEPLLAACLDPAFPLVVLTLEGVQAAGENRVEAALVAKLVLALRQGLRDGKGKPYETDAAFFKDGVFIVSPHRAQNRAIRRELSKHRAWTARPFVDTVDKMQGQEADAVVVSYGVSDPEYALMEAEFIYSLNRLNVSITRARAKSIVCLPRPLLDASPQVLDFPEAARGLAFMRGLVQAVAPLNPPLTFDLGDGVRATVYRADR